MRACRCWPSALNDTVGKLWLTAAAATGNPLLLDLYLEIGSALRTVLRDRAQRDDFDRFLVAGHGSLLAAIRAGDPEAAVREASLNVETSGD